MMMTVNEDGWHIHEGGVTIVGRRGRQEARQRCAAARRDCFDFRGRRRSALHRRGAGGVLHAAKVTLVVCYIRQKVQRTRRWRG